MRVWMRWGRGRVIVALVLSGLVILLFQRRHGDVDRAVNIPGPNSLRHHSEIPILVSGSL